MTLFQSFIHAVQWRIIAVIIDFIVVYIMTGELHLSFAVAGISAVVRTLVHTVWAWIKFRGLEGELYRWKK